MAPLRRQPTAPVVTVQVRPEVIPEGTEVEAIPADAAAELQLRSGEGPITAPAATSVVVELEARFPGLPDGTYYLHAQVADEHRYMTFTAPNVEAKS